MSLTITLLPTSGTQNLSLSEDHGRWHDVMEEIASLEAQNIEDTGVLVEQDAKSLQQDLKAAGELVRQGEYTTNLSQTNAQPRNRSWASPLTF